MRGLGDPPARPYENGRGCIGVSGCFDGTPTELRITMTFYSTTAKICAKINQSYTKHQRCYPWPLQWSAKWQVKEILSMTYQQIIVVGNVGRDPELRYTPSGIAVTDFPRGGQPELDQSRRRAARAHHLVARDVLAAAGRSCRAVRKEGAAGNGHRDAGRGGCLH